MRSETQALVTAALLGTERRPLTLAALSPGTPGPLAEAFARLDEGTAMGDARWSAEKLLTAAALAFQHERAGTLPPAAHDEPARGDATSVCPSAPAPLDERPRVSPLAERLLATLLAGRFGELLPEWLRHAAAASARSPEPLLPALLDWGRTEPALLGTLRAVVGARGLWLAKENPAWDYVLSAGDEAHFETGSRGARLAILGSLRERDPAGARALLASAFRTSAAEERAILLATLARRLSLADEQFLESALDDRAREVRRAAAELLARLPGSALAARMRARVEHRIELSGSSLEVILPESCDASLARDGIVAKAPAGTGEKGFWMAQMLGAVPPSLFTARFGTTPRALLEAAGRGDWNALLVEGWARGAERHRDEDWAEALLATRHPDSTRRLARLVEVLSPARREALIAAELRGRRPPMSAMHEGVALLLRPARHPWSLAFTRTVVSSLRDECHRNPDAWPVLGSLLPHAAVYMDPAILADPTTPGLGLPDPSSRVTRWVELGAHFVPLLQTRLDIRRAFAPTATVPGLEGMT